MYKSCGDPLYEILEAYANRENKSCTATIDDVRGWLKVPDDAYQSWKDFRRNVVDIAVDEINAYADLAGFTVDYEAIRDGKAFTKIRFTVTRQRDDTDGDADDDDGHYSRALAAIVWSS